MNEPRLTSEAKQEIKRYMRTYLLGIVGIVGVGTVLAVWGSTRQAAASAAEVIASNPKSIATELVADPRFIDSVAATTLNVPIGTIVAHSGSLGDDQRSRLRNSGWIVCDGQPLSQSEFAELFEAIGYAWGSPGGQSFNVPDLRGRFLRGIDGGTNRDADAKSRGAAMPGGNTGDSVGSIQEDAVGKHTHQFQRFEYTVRTGDGPYRDGLTPNTDRAFMRDTTGAVPEASESRPKNANVYWIIPRQVNDGSHDLHNGPSAHRRRAKRAQVDVRVQPIR